KTIDLTVKAHKIKFDKLEHNNHQFILGTFPYLPFKQKSFDLIIAPWFFDIIDRDFKTSLKYTLNYLKPAGKLAIYGPANIHAKDIIDQLTAQEITEHLASFCDGIELTTNELTYLQNNMTSQNRLEEIMFLTGTLKNEINLNQSLPAKKESRLRFTPPFENYKAVNETFYHILKHITDDLTSAELAQIMIKEFSFKEDEAQFYAENFINKIQSEI
ncbi:MAG: methyltransferase domain-containing protein, partial [Halobacteriovoraceae bacterium]|nr:methyltransferase domain-containing protein [Halobacteriovoraceae bacterium]